MTILIKNIDEISNAAKSILNYSKNRKIFSFYGELGVGKTTLIKEMCKQLEAEEGSSPTFALINEYKTRQGNIIYHFDLYRLKYQSEIFDIGYEEYIHSGNYCFIEWPEKIESLLPDNTIKVKIRLKNCIREIEF